MGRNSAKELARIVATIGGYLDRAEDDRALPLSYDAIERATGVSRGHLSRRKDPEIIALVLRIANLRGRHDEAPAAAVSATEASSSASLISVLPTEALANLLQREMREIGRQQEQWVSRHARAEAHDAPLALHDADELLRGLRSAVERLRPLVQDWNRRHGIVAGANHDEPELRFSM